jgi:hypothetical protein
MWSLTGYEYRNVRKVITMGTQPKWIGMVVIWAMLLLASAGPGYAWQGGHGGGGHRGHGWHGGHGWRGPRIGIGIGLGPFWGPSWAPYAYPYAYAYPPVVVAPPPVVVQPRQQLSIEQSPSESYWYYCDNPQGYYPYVQQCPGGWRAVAPTPP